MASPYRVLGLTLLPLLRWRISRVHGIEHIPRGGFVAVANHQSWIDSAIIAAALYRHVDKSIRFIAQSSKWRIFGGIPIDEYDKGRVLDVASGYLEVGHPIMVFPEGNSNRNPELRTGKTGAARLALRSGAPVLPIGIHGTRGVKAWKALAWFLQWWQPCTIEIGATTQFPAETIHPHEHERLMEVTESIMQSISAVSGKPLAEHQVGEPPRVRQPWMKAIALKIIYPLNRWRVTVRGGEYLPDRGPFIIAANHMSYYDGPALTIAILRLRKIQPYYPTKAAVTQTFKALLGQGGLDALGLLPLDTRDRARVLRYAEQHLRSGGVIGIFPESTRNKPGLNPDYPYTMLKGKTGTARLFLTTGVPVIPASIQAPEGLSIWKAALNVIAFWKRMIVTFGSPVQLEQKDITTITKDELEAMTKKIMLSIGELSGQKYPF